MVSAAVRKGLPVRAFGAALAFLVGLRRERLPANPLQAQRDYFGAHTWPDISNRQRWPQSPAGPLRGRQRLETALAPATEGAVHRRADARP
ncbi:MAG: hypothetical protein FJ387_30015, partial [Verrucomicrobia bacterium]|nr:hypothetical protein [Verrucomicrobiota bacterium]